LDEGRRQWPGGSAQAGTLPSPGARRPTTTQIVLLAFSPQPSEQKLVSDCIQRQIVFAAWPQSLQQQNILIIFADSEQRYFAIAAGLMSGCLRGSAQVK